MYHQPVPAKVLHHARLLIMPGSSLVVGVSGGSDSVALLHLLVHLAKPLKIDKIFVAHCNHGLRGDASDGDEALVRSMADKLGLPFFVKQFEGRTIDASGLEAWGRQERYAFFHRYAEKTAAAQLQLAIPSMIRLRPCSCACCGGVV